MPPVIKSSCSYIYIAIAAYRSKLTIFAIAIYCAILFSFFGEKNQYVYNEVLKEVSARNSEAKEDEVQGM